MVKVVRSSGIDCPTAITTCSSEVQPGMWPDEVHLCLLYSYILFNSFSIISSNAFSLIIFLNFSCFQGSHPGLLFTEPLDWEVVILALWYHSFSFLHGLLPIM
jgi:hypothetical protein